MPRYRWHLSDKQPSPVCFWDFLRWSGDFPLHGCFWFFVFVHLNAPREVFLPHHKPPWFHGPRCSVHIRCTSCSSVRDEVVGHKSAACLRAVTSCLTCGLRSIISVCELIFSHITSENVLINDLGQPRRWCHYSVAVVAVSVMHDNSRSATGERASPWCV